jgi:hypothetical protein
MRKKCFLICLATLMAFVVSGRAEASPLTLTITGTALDNVVNSVSDVSNGFPQPPPQIFVIPSSAKIWGNLDQFGGRSIQSTINLQATLSDDTRNLASITLTGPIGASFETSSHANNGYIFGWFGGGAKPGALQLAPGVEPVQIPSWFPGLSVGVYGAYERAHAYSDPYLVIVPGSSTPTTPQPVPEPTSLAVFLTTACACVGLRRYRRV